MTIDGLRPDSKKGVVRAASVEGCRCAKWTARLHGRPDTEASIEAGRLRRRRIPFG